MRKIFLALISSVLLSGTAFAEEVKIGIILGFTGPIESLTPDMGAGAELAIAEVNGGGAARASLVAMMAGADFIKTSTGKEGINANLPVSLVMLRAIREFHQRTGTMVGFKPAGGIRAARDAISYLILMREELGLAWLNAHYFRIGASGLLGDISRQLEHYLSGRYSASHRHPMG